MGKSQAVVVVEKSEGVAVVEKSEGVVVVEKSGGVVKHSKTLHLRELCVQWMVLSYFLVQATCC